VGEKGLRANPFAINILALKSFVLNILAPQIARKQQKQKTLRPGSGEGGVPPKLPGQGPSGNRFPQSQHKAKIGPHPQGSFIWMAFPRRFFAHTGEFVTLCLQLPDREEHFWHGLPVF
jgi:hypothetical protein